MTRSYSRRWGAALTLVVDLLAALDPASAQDVVISEFQARNAMTIVDADGDSSDWIEIYNASGATVSLRDWALTDDAQDPAKWLFPAVQVEAGGFLLVFASGKDRRDPVAELHTNFRLDSGGEFLGLLSPSGVFTSRFAPAYPEQVLDASYGFPMSANSATILVPESPARFLVPLRGSDLDREWNLPTFDDVAWTVGASAVGYDFNEASTVSEFVETDVGTDLFEANSSIFLRIPVASEELLGAQVLQFRVRYDSGFVAYLNGVELVRRNVIRTRYNSSASEPRTALDVRSEDVLTVPILPGTVLPEGNVLAVHAQNDDRSSPDFLFSLALYGVRADGLAGSAPKFFSVPTPGWLNPATGKDGEAAVPRFSVAGRSFVGSLEVSVQRDAPAAQIRYTLDGSLPHERSQLYSEPLVLTEVSRITVRAFEPGRLPSQAVSETYLAMDEETFGFTSDLPIFVVWTFGRLPGTNSLLPMHMEVMDVGESGRATMNGPREFVGLGGIKGRGSSTAGRPKKAYSVEVRDLFGRDQDAEILGFPADSDFILYAAYNFDRALMRNAFMYRLANTVGRYAVRDKFCEVFVASRGGVIDSQTYVGVYSFLEKIGRGQGRVDVESLPPEALSEPDITGGYILKIDRPDPGDNGFVGAGQEIRYVYPKEEVIQERPEQVEWLRNYFNAFGDLLRTTSLADAQSYGDFIDVPSWIDHHLLNEFAKNPDGFWLSTYFYKPRGGKVHMGPIWDFDRSLGPNDDDRARSPLGWSGVINSNWWGTLLRDDEFLSRRAERWLELREGPFATDRVLGLIEEMRATLRESQARNFQRWRLALGTDGWEGQVDRLSAWVADRLVWMDGELTPPPRFSLASGVVEPGEVLKLEVVRGDILYTINGPDPRAPDGAVALEALVYSGPIVITSNTRVRARTLLGTATWSDEVSASFATVVPEIIVSEFMYEPPRFDDDQGSATNFEYIELLNADDQPVDLAGWSYRQDSPRVLFEFPVEGDTILEPGEYGVVVRKLNFFRARYGEEPRVFGEYDSTLSNFGDTISIDGPLGEPFVSFEYSGDWNELADGGGHSLILREPPLPRSEWSTAAAWEPSARVGGSPGRSDVVISGRVLPGDLSQDGKLGVTDAVVLLQMIVGKVEGPCSTRAANDVVANVGGGPFVDLADALLLLNYLFLGGAAPVAGLDCIVVEDCPEVCGA